MKLLLLLCLLCIIYVSLVVSEQKNLKQASINKPLTAKHSKSNTKHLSKTQKNKRNRNRKRSNKNKKTKEIRKKKNKNVNEKKEKSKIMKRKYIRKNDKLKRKKNKMTNKLNKSKGQNEKRRGKNKSKKRKGKKRKDKGKMKKRNGKSKRKSKKRRNQQRETPNNVKQVSSCRNVTCLNTMLQVLKINKDQVQNFLKQNIRITKKIALAGSKGSKSSNVKSSLSSLMSSLGGESALKNNRAVCHGKYNITDANEANELYIEMAKCDKKIKADCKVSLGDDEISELASCQNTMISFR